MLKKVISIENVGKFRSCKARGDVELRRLNVIYGENGRGKSTLCDVLRSLAMGDGARIAGRTTLGESAAPCVSLRMEGGNVEFRGGAWSETHPEIEVFDAAFVHENVYAGEFVELDHRRGLYGVIIGATGVALQRAVEDLDAASRDAARRVREAQGFERHVPAGFYATTFLKLPPIESLEEKLSTAEAEVASLERSEEIRSKDALAQLIWPALPADFEEVLGKSIGGVSADVASRVREHRETQTNGATEEWLGQGVRFRQSSRCPFCAQDTSTNDLVAALQTLFGDSYRSLQSAVSELDQAVRGLDSEAAKLRLSQTLERNEERSRFWKPFVEHEAPALHVEELFGALKAMRLAATTLVARKQSVLLETIGIDEAFRTAREGLVLAQGRVATYNESVTDINGRIAAKKAATASGNLAVARAQLATLRATKARFAPEATAACQEYLDAVEAKKQVEVQKEEAKRALDKHGEAMLPQFESRINELLEHFGADFRIRAVERTYSGGKASSTYQLVVNEVPIELGDSKTPIGTPSFRNTLSAGDRSALALAFFLVRLELDPRVSEKIVVFDDPFNSQDSTRRRVTQQRICRLAKKAKQVVVLSHEAGFLRLIYDAVPSADIKTLQLARVGFRETIMSEWDVVEATRGDYFKDYWVLFRFAHEGEGERRFVVRTIRPLLEGYLRFVFPHAFGDSEWLGDFIEKIRSAGDADPLASMRPALEELEDINDFSKKYHHQQNPSADSEPIDGGELATFVKRALKMVGAPPTWPTSER